MKKFCSFLLILFFCLNFTALKASDEIPTTIDSRIKTIVYNENEIYDLKFFYGFQSFIEISDDEEIEMISLGEAFPWKITPVGKRIFIRPIQIGANTNMMIITTKRIYQFQIQSGSYEEGADEELIYSVRFYYPDLTRRYAKSDKKEEKVKTFLELDKDGRLNFDYLMTGNIEDLAPVKVFDNGINTYFEFKNKNAFVPSIYAVDVNGEETLLDYDVEGEYIVINSKHLQFSLRDGSELLCIFNNQMINK